MMYDLLQFIAMVMPAVQDFLSVPFRSSTQPMLRLAFQLAARASVTMRLRLPNNIDSLGWF
jgi:hypothetical protein